MRRWKTVVFSILGGIALTIASAWTPMFFTQVYAPTTARLEYAGGLPWRALAGAVEGTGETAQTRNAIYIVSNDGLSGTLLPLQPLWPGFLLDVMLFASIIALFCLCPGVVRRLSRRMGKRCEACGYDLRAAKHNQCPECGATRR